MKVMNKKERHALIKKVITQNEIKTQEQLVEELAKNGILTQVRYQLEKYGQISHQEAFC